MAGSVSQIVIRSKLQNESFQGMSWVQYFYEESVYNTVFFFEGAVYTM